MTVDWLSTLILSTLCGECLISTLADAHYALVGKIFFLQISLKSLKMTWNVQKWHYSLWGNDSLPHKVSTPHKAILYARVSPQGCRCESTHTHTHTHTHIHTSVLQFDLTGIFFHSNHGLDLNSMTSILRKVLSIAVARNLMPVWSF